MTSIFSQVNHDAVGPGELSQGRSGDRIRFARFSCLAYGGDMIHIDRNSDHGFSFASSWQSAISSSVLDMGIGMGEVASTHGDYPGANR
jgi:hypothetical protein